MAESFLMMAGGCAEHVTEPGREFGTITGKVVNEAGKGLRGVNVFVHHTDISATTNDTGAYTVFHLPEGEYHLFLDSSRMPDARVSATVMPNQTSVAPPLVISFSPSAPVGMPSYSVNHLQLFSCEDSSIQKYTPLPLAEPLFADSIIPYDIYLTKTDCISLECTMHRTDSFTDDNDRKPTIITHNRDTVYAHAPLKGRVQCHTMNRTGDDTLLIFINDSTVEQFVVWDSLPGQFHDTLNYCRLVVGEMSITKAKRSSEDFFILNEDTFTAVFEYPSVFLYEINLVEAQTHDTCSVNNNAELHNSPACTRRRSASWEFLSDSLPNGVYDVYVDFLGAPADSLEAQTRLNLFLGKAQLTGQILHYFRSQPERALKQGESWYAGRISFPDFIYDPGVQEIDNPVVSVHTVTPHKVRIGEVEP